MRSAWAIWAFVRAFLFKGVVYRFSSKVLFTLNSLSLAANWSHFVAPGFKARSSFPDTQDLSAFCSIRSGAKRPPLPPLPAAPALPPMSASVPRPAGRGKYCIGNRFTLIDTMSSPERNSVSPGSSMTFLPAASPLLRIASRNTNVYMPPRLPCCCPGVGSTGVNTKNTPSYVHPLNITTSALSPIIVFVTLIHLSRHATL